MKRFLFVIVAVAGLTGGCNKPEAGDCRKAIVNMEKLLGTASVAGANSDLEGEVRRCKGGSSRESVACAESATTLDQLKACGFMSPKPAK